MSVAGPDGRFIKVNASLCRMLGYSQAEMLSLKWVDVTHPDDVALGREWASRLRNEPCEQRSHGEKRYIHRSGEVVWARSSLLALRDSTGEVRNIVLHAEDITERKGVEAALQESEARFRIMADGCPTMMWVTDAEGGTGFINRAYREFFGIAEDRCDDGQMERVAPPGGRP